MSFGLFKVVFCISFLIFGFQSNFSDKNTDLPNSFSCSERDSISFPPDFYRQQTKASLLALANEKHPVGLFYLAKQKYNQRDYQEALELLDSAADAGLTTAYDLMAHIYKEQGNNSAALNAKQCFLKRLRISHQK